MCYIFGQSTFDEFCLASQLALLLLDQLAKVAVRLDGFVLLVEGGAGAESRDLAFNASECRCVRDLVLVEECAEIASLIDSEVH